MSTVLATAVKAALTTHLLDGNVETNTLLRPTAVDFDEAAALHTAGTLPYIHVIVTLTRRFGEGTRLSPYKALTGWRLTTTVVGTTVDEARWAAVRVARAEYTRFAAAGLDCSPLMFESEQPPEPDDGSYSGVTFWTFTSTPAL